MGNNFACLTCTITTADVNDEIHHTRVPGRGRRKRDRRPNPFSDSSFSFDSPASFRVLKDAIPFTPHRSRIGEKYVLGRELGRGEFGVTYLCIDKATREVLACKSISKRKLRTAVDVDDVRREVAIMSALPNHPNIVRLRAAHEDANAVHLVMELCKGGELFDHIVARGHYSERAAAAVARTVAEVVRMCHSNGVIHRDLKPENFLYATKKENSSLKVIDFGLSIFFSPGERFSEIVGSPYYMAPEVLKELWPGETEHGVARAILRGEINFHSDPWPRVSESAKSLVKQMLHPDPKRRLTAQQVLEHPWLQNAKNASNVPLGGIVRARLKQFSAMNRFKKKAMRVIAERLSIEEVEIIREMFSLMDTNNDGKVTYEELKAGLQKVGSQLAEAEIKMMMEVADVDGNGTLDYGEFVAVTIHLQRLENEAHLYKAFTFFDKNNSSYIEIEELREALADDNGELDDKVLNIIMGEVDTDKDGRISYEEFVAMMKSGTDWRQASRQYSRERFKSLGINLLNDGSISTVNCEGSNPQSR
ncbi:hypothetical protein HPP92_018236 [Vanilla planifolia]|uniref:non-specific serine/threonine protein kinase n=1 Tax=Vanilla planifolia TaxID=51239 RepID=A0A835UPB2_VANPL|nr:hypothetical protein HPP92_018236 [Vanilla planifolia]